MNANENQLATLVELLKKEGIAPTGGSEVMYIVYVDDEVDLLEPVTEAVSLLGFKPYTTTSPQEALEFSEKQYHQIAYIISDYRMATTTGFELREKLLAVVPEIPFVILSANITKELALKGIDLKISGFLEKPITTDKLAEVLQKDGIARIQAIKEDRELLQGFLEEASINLEQAEELSLAFEQNPNDLDAVNKCFGLVHTLKGARGFFKPKTLHQFVHRFEDLLKSIQRGEAALTAGVVSSILKSFDLVKVLLNEFKTREHQKYDLELIFKEYFSIGDDEKSNIAPSQVLENQSGAPAVQRPKAPAHEVSNELKVSVKLLDEFMQTSGEMTVIRNMINKYVRSIDAQLPRNKDVSMLSELLEELHEINASIQLQVSNLRKVPVHNILKPITRIVRDVSKTLGKEVEIIAVGDELAVDTAIAAVLSNSIVHLVRNSLDHGLEPPQDREQQGKNRKGKVTITSSQKNDFIFICIEDDGRGLNEDSIRKKLVKNGTHTEAQTQALAKRELYAMIFEAGFSTAEKVTDISGRGVGMSMVKDSVVSVGGRIDIESFPNKGSKFTLVLPVPKSVLIRDCLFVISNGMMFGIPQDDVVRVVRVPVENNPNVFQSQGSISVNFDDCLISVLDLGELLETTAKSAPTCLGADILNLIIIGNSTTKLALKVDSILDIEDTVIKQLQYPTKKIEVFQGAAFLGDGTIGLILSTEGLLKKAKISPGKAIDDKVESEFKSHNNVSDLILFHLGGQSLYAIKRQEIFRIEEFDSSSIQFAAGSQVIPYRNKILTLLHLPEILKNKSEKLSEHMNSRVQTLVIERNGQFLGFMVTSIEDIAQVEGEYTSQISPQFGLLGNYLLGDRTITLLNVEEIIDSFAKKNDISLSTDTSAMARQAA